MLIEDLLGSNTFLTVSEKHTIKTNCSQFIAESANTPLFKTLPTTYHNFQRVKARLQRRQNELTDVYTKAFNHNNIRQRAIFAYASKPSVSDSLDLFYIFPTNGYKFLYCTEVANSSSDYQLVLDTLFEQFNDTVKVTEIVTDLLKYTYLTDNLYDGIVAQAEIILYNIPHYYAVRANVGIDYVDMISQITKINH
jgi:hypothetical protein